MASNTSLGAGGLRDAMSCDVCMEEYDHDSKTPLVLPCGHTFCRSCLAAIRGSGQVQCPSCRAQHNVQLEALTVNYSLLSIGPLCNDMEYEECPSHRDSLRYFCCTCGLPLCSLCIHCGHPQGHNIKLAQSIVQEIKLKLVEEIESHISATKEQKQKLKEDFSDLDTWMKELFRRNANLQNDAEDLKKLLAKVEKFSDLTSIKSLEEAVREGKIELSERGDESERAAKGAANINTSVQQKQSMVEFRDGRLLLHSLAQPDSTTLSLQMPSEVFLELSVGDRRLGCVFISLWSHMRLAQQFLALCMGTMRPSLLGIKASDKLRSILIFRFGVGENNATIRTPILTNLEWGGTNAKTETTGYVMGVDGNQNMAFGICIKKHPHSVLNAPFGNVVAGLDVAEEAFQHNPVTEVTVTHCGLVLPGLSPTPPQSIASDKPFQTRLQKRTQHVQRSGLRLGGGVLLLGAPQRRGVLGGRQLRRGQLPRGGLLRGGRRRGFGRIACDDGFTWDDGFL